MEGLDIQSIIRDTVREYRAQEGNLAAVVEERNQLREALRMASLADVARINEKTMDAQKATIDSHKSSMDKLQSMLTWERAIAAKLRTRLESLSRIAMQMES